MTTPSRNVSVIEPVGRALDRVNVMLFRPFDLGKWFTIGFCAWLALLGESGGGGGFHFNVPSGGSHHGGNVRRELERAWEYVLANLFWIVPLAVTLVVVGLAFWVLFKWLSSRGHFMFLHCVALNRAAVVEPWNEFAREANNLFLFRLVLGLLSIITTLPLVVLGVVLAWRLFVTQHFTVAGVMGLGALVLAIVALSLICVLIEKLTKDFVVPLMYLRRRGCVECWGELLTLLRGYAGEFILWLLFQIVLGLAVSAIVLAAVVVTCCIACCVLALPYVGTVLLLPVLIFERAYALHFLAQFGPTFDVFTPSRLLDAGAAPSAAA